MLWYSCSASSQGILSNRVIFRVVMLWLAPGYGRAAEGTLRWLFFSVCQDHVRLVVPRKNFLCLLILCLNKTWFTKQDLFRWKWSVNADVALQSLSTLEKSRLCCSTYLPRWETMDLILTSRSVDGEGWHCVPVFLLLQGLVTAAALTLPW